MFPRPLPYLPYPFIRTAAALTRSPQSRQPLQFRNVSLSLFRDKKPSSSPPQDPVKCGVPSLYDAGTSEIYPPLRLETAVSARPKRETRRIPLFPEGDQWKGIKGDSAGDDAWVLGKYYLGVADGVGAWNMKENGRPGLWARLLMHYWALECEERMKLWKVNRSTIPSSSTTAPSVAFNLFGNEEKIDVISMLQRAYLRTVCAMENSGGWVGSTTACVALLQRSTLHIANLGDSRAFIVRGNKLVFSTDEQQHWYDCPYQVGTNSVDTPMNDATSHVVKLLPSDTIVIATDGLGDNLWEEEILTEAAGITESGQATTPNRSVRDIADALCKKARAVGEDKWGESPYMERAIMEGLPFHGGKLDDITVIVARAELDE